GLATVVIYLFSPLLTLEGTMKDRYGIQYFSIIAPSTISISDAKKTELVSPGRKHRRRHVPGPAGRLHPGHNLEMVQFHPTGMTWSEDYVSNFNNIHCEIPH